MTKLLRNEKPTGPYTLKKRISDSEQITLVILNSEAKVVPILRDGQLVFQAKIRLESRISETSNYTFNTMDEKFLLAVEKAVGDQMAQECQAVFQKSQDEFNTDFFGFCRLVRNYRYKYWQEHQNEWPEVYKTAVLEPVIEMHIRRLGLKR